MLSEAEVSIPELPLEILNPRERKPDERDDESSQSPTRYFTGTAHETSRTTTG